MTDSPQYYDLSTQTYGLCSSFMFLDSYVRRLTQGVHKFVENPRANLKGGWGGRTVT